MYLCFLYVSFPNSEPAVGPTQFFTSGPWNSFCSGLLETLIFWPSFNVLMCLMWFYIFTDKVAFGFHSSYDSSWVWIWRNQESYCVLVLLSNTLCDSQWLSCSARFRFSVLKWRIESESGLKPPSSQSMCRCVGETRWRRPSVSRWPWTGSGVRPRPKPSRTNCSFTSAARRSLAGETAGWRRRTELRGPPCSSAPRRVSDTATPESSVGTRPRQQNTEVQHVSGKQTQHVVFTPVMLCLGLCWFFQQEARETTSWSNWSNFNR